MAEYIEREKALKRVKALGDPNFELKSDGWNSAICEAVEELNELPAADVRPERHGRWIKDESGVIICSECGEEHDWIDYRANFCEQCGAKMSWEDNDNG